MNSSFSTDCQDTIPNCSFEDETYEFSRKGTKSNEFIIDS